MTSSRVLLGLVILFAVGVLVFLLVGNPFAPDTVELDGGARDGRAPGEVRLDEGGAAPGAVASKDRALAGGFELLGKGDVKARLLSFKDRKPLVGQAVRLVLRDGESAERSTGDDGRVVFLGLRAAKSWTLSIEGKGFSPVEMKG